MRFYRRGRPRCDGRGLTRAFKCRADSVHALLELRLEAVLDGKLACALRKLPQHWIVLRQSFNVGGYLRRRAKRRTQSGARLLTEALPHSIGIAGDRQSSSERLR